MSTLTWRRSEKGLLSTIYTEQKSSSKHRNHKPPAYTLGELTEWFYQQPNSKVLYTVWVDSNYDKWLRPSVDRLVNTLGYSLENIQLTSFRDNNQRSHNDASEGLNIVSLLKSVDQYDLKGNFIQSYKSLTKASKATGQSAGAICISCNNKEYHAKKWLWKYSEDLHTPKYLSKGKFVYTLLNTSGDAIIKFTDLTKLRQYLGSKDLSPLNKAIRKGVNYRNQKWTRGTK
jgi:hypothetical protein